MKVEKMLYNYIVASYGEENVENVMLNNRFLQYSYSKNSHNVHYLKNKAKVLQMQNEMLKICQLLDENEIKYITFKGIVLANKLYENIYVRYFKDIDIYVSTKDFNLSYEIMLSEGYKPCSTNNFSDEHHIVLSNGRVVVELHKNILNPRVKIDEIYLKKNVTSQRILQKEITTFSITATLLHLLYHLYMDVVFESQFYNAIYKNEFSLSKRFLYRAYEIALYSERYYEQIHWEEIEKDIQKQNILPYFKSMVHGISKIFSNTFPKTLLETINSKEYEIKSDDINQAFCEFLVENDISEYIRYMGEFISQNWNGIAKLNLAKYKRVEFSVPYHRWTTEIDEEDYSDFQCTCVICNRKDGLDIYFQTLQQENYFSDDKNLDDWESDGIHFFLYSIYGFSYRSIFLFPKVTASNKKVTAVDFLNKRIVDDIECEVDISEIGYKVKISLDKQFIIKHHMEGEFYIGVIVAKCCARTGKRVRELTMSPNVEEWYSPTRFVKIIR